MCDFFILLLIVDFQQLIIRGFVAVQLFNLGSIHLLPFGKSLFDTILYFIYNILNSKFSNVKLFYTVDLCIRIIFE